MTDKKQPEALRLAGLLELAPENGVEPQTTEDAAAELRRLHAENETLRAKIKAYEDLDEAASDVQLLRMGYAAARLEIESLQSRIKTMAEERSDELTVAHLDGRMRAAQPAGAQQPAPSVAAHPACKPDMLVNAGALKLALNVLRRAGKHEVADELEKTAQAAPAAVAGQNEMPTVPDSVLAYVHAYGDSRADEDGLSGMRVSELILALRRWAKSIAAAPTTQPAPQQEAQEPAMWAMWRESTGWLAASAENTRDECIAKCSETAVAEGMPTDFAAAQGWVPRPLYASPASQGDASEVLDIPDQCPYFGPSPHRDVWLDGWYAARKQARSKP